MILLTLEDTGLRERCSWLRAHLPSGLTLDASRDSLAELLWVDLGPGAAFLPALCILDDAVDVVARAHALVQLLVDVEPELGRVVVERGLLGGQLRRPHVEVDAAQPQVACEVRAARLELHREHLERACGAVGAAIVLVEDRLDRREVLKVRPGPPAKI